MNICGEQLKFKHDEWINRQHGNKIQVPTTPWSTASIKALSSQTTRKNSDRGMSPIRQ